MNPDQTYKIEETWKIIEFESEIELTNILCVGGKEEIKKKRDNKRWE
jgi:hypothetical protein